MFLRCTKSNIIDCLRSIGIEPSTSTNEIYPDPKRYPENVIDYNIDIDDAYFQALTDSPRQWWLIDFKRIVFLHSYTLIANSGCNFVTEWQLDVSFDKKKWEKIHNHSNSFSTNQEIQFQDFYEIRYARLTGSTPLCNGEDKLPRLFAFQKIYFYGSVALYLPTCKTHSKFLSLLPLTYIFIIISK